MFPSPRRLAPVLLLLGLFSLAAGAREAGLGLTTHLGDRQQFVEGDRIVLLLSLERDAFIYLFYRDAEQRLWQLLPSAQMRQHHFRAGAFMALPRQDAPLVFVVRPPFGEETVFAFASDREDLEFEGVTEATGMRRVKSGFAALQASIDRQSGTIYDFASLRLQTRAAQAPGE